jgi:hypothetical protein
MLKIEFTGPAAVRPEFNIGDVIKAEDCEDTVAVVVTMDGGKVGYLRLPDCKVTVVYESLRWMRNCIGDRYVPVKATLTIH